MSDYAAIIEVLQRYGLTPDQALNAFNDLTIAGLIVMDKAGFERIMTSAANTAARTTLEHADKGGHILNAARRDDIRRETLRWAANEVASTSGDGSHHACSNTIAAHLRACGDDPERVTPAPRATSENDGPTGTVTAMDGELA